VIFWSLSNSPLIKSGLRTLAPILLSFSLSAADKERQVETGEENKRTQVGAALFANGIELSKNN